MEFVAQMTFAVNELVLSGASEVIGESGETGCKKLVCVDETKHAYLHGHVLFRIGGDDVNVLRFEAVSEVSEDEMKVV